jgi:hypothetical protein
MKKLFLFALIALPLHTAAQSEYLTYQKGLTLSALGGFAKGSGYTSQSYGCAAGLNSFLDIGLMFGSQSADLEAAEAGTGDRTVNTVMPYVSYHQIRKEGEVLGYSATASWLIFEDMGDIKIFPLSFSVFRDIRILDRLIIYPEAGVTIPAVFGKAWHFDPSYHFSVMLSTRLHEQLFLMAGPQYTIADVNSAGAAFGLAYRLKK